MTTAQLERLRTAALEWVEAKVRTERRIALAVIASTAVTALAVAALLWCVMAYAVIVSTRLLGVPGGWWDYLIITAAIAGLYGWYARNAVREGGIPALPEAPRWMAIPGLLLGTLFALLGGRFMTALWMGPAQRNSLDAGAAAANGCAAAWLLGPSLFVRTWLAVRRHGALGAIDTAGCAAVVALCLERHRKVAFEELERLLPHVSVTQLRHDLLLFDGVRILPGPPPGVALGAIAAGQITALLERGTVPALRGSLSA